MGPRSTMKPPADRLLNLQGTGTDVPAVAPLRYGVPSSVVFAAATLLALFSTLMAWRFTAVARPRSQVRGARSSS